MSPDWAKEVVSHAPETVKSELLKMISIYVEQFKYYESKDLVMDYFQNHQKEIYNFVSKNKQILKQDTDSIIQIILWIFVELKMDFTVNSEFYIEHAQCLFIKILEILSKNDSINWVSPAVSWDVIWILEWQESQEKVPELEQTNLWKPTCPDIEINPGVASETIPQAWENNWNWYYNFPWALAEAEFLGKKIPTKEEWEELIRQDEKSILNMSKAGIRTRSNGLYYNQGTLGYYWSSSPGTTFAFYLYFHSANVRPTYANSRAYGFTVRCLKD